MAKGTPITEVEEQAILEALKAGKTTREVAKEFDRGSGTISQVARRNGLDLGARALAKKADLVRTCYASEARIRLVGKLLDKAEELMATCDNPRDLQPLATAIAIGIDKRRLEEATDPSARGGEIRILFDKMGEVGE